MSEVVAEVLRAVQHWLQWGKVVLHLLFVSFPCRWKICKSTLSEILTKRHEERG